MTSAVNPWEIESQPIVTYCPARHICLILFGRTVAPLVVVMEEQDPPGAYDSIPGPAGAVILPIHERSEYRKSLRPLPLAAPMLSGGGNPVPPLLSRRAAQRYRGGVQGSGARGSRAVTTSTTTGPLAASACWRAAAIWPGCSTRIPRTPKLRATSVKSVGPKRISASPRSARSPAIRCNPAEFWPKRELLLAMITTGM